MAGRSSTLGNSSKQTNKHQDCGLPVVDKSVVTVMVGNGLTFLDLDDLVCLGLATKNQRTVEQ